MNHIKILGACFIITMIIAFPQKAHAQENPGVFIMSTVGSLHNFSNNGMVVVYSSSAKCLTIQNGTSVLIGERGSSNFSANCEVNVKFNTLGLKLYPNPAINTTRVKVINPPNANDVFSVSIYGIEGNLFGSNKATANELIQGKALNVSHLPAGSYMLQIVSDKYIDAVKFIKTN